MNRYDQKCLVAIYLRLSREDGDLSGSSGKQESNSISNQRQLIHYYLNEHPEMTLVEEYCDDGFTGINFERPGFQAMLKAISEKKVNCVIAKDLSRIGRDYIMTGHYLQIAFPSMGVRFISVTDHIDTMNAQSSSEDLLIAFKNLINDSYCRDISIKIRSNLEIKRKSGEFVGSAVIYGYRRSKENRYKLEIDEKVAPVIQDIFRWKIDGKSPAQIAERLNCLGILPPREYKRSSGVVSVPAFQKRASSGWGPLAIYRILKNEMYAGCLVQGKTTTPNYKVKKRITKDPSKWDRTANAHEAIIPPDQFQLVQELMHDDTRIMDGSDSVHMLSGRIFCADCGGMMIRKVTHSGKKQYISYTCSTHRNDKTKCATNTLSERIVLNAILSVLHTQIAIALDLETALSKIDSVSWESRELDKIEAGIERQRRKQINASKMKGGLIGDLHDGLINQQEFQFLSADFERQIDEAQHAILKLEASKLTIAQGLTAQQNWIRQFTEYKNITTLDRRTIVTFIASVKIHHDQTVTVKLRNADLFESAMSMAQELDAAPALGETAAKEVV